MIKIDFDSNDEGDDMGAEEAMGGVASLLIIVIVVCLYMMS